MEHLRSLLKRFFEKPEYVFVIPALMFGVLSAFLMPQLIANDENMHFVRSYELTEIEFSHKCTLPKDIKERGFFAMYARANPDYSFETKIVDGSNKMKTDCGSATSYNPILHLPQTLGVATAKLIWPTTGGMILFGRLANVLFYCLALFFIIRKAKIGKWLLVVIGLLPMMIHTASSLTGDVVNNIILLGFVSYMFNLFTQKKAMSKKQIALLFVASALLAATKMTNLVLLLPVLFLPKKVLPNVRVKGKIIPAQIMRFCVGAICGVVAIAMVLAWSSVYGSSVAGGIGDQNQVIEKPYRFLKILFNTYLNPDIMLGGVSYSDWLLRGVVGSFASFRYHLPYGVVTLLIGLLMLIGFRKDTEEEKNIEKTINPLMISTLVALVLAVLAMTYGLYAAWAIRPDVLGSGAQFALGLQGRYFTPLIILLLPALIYLRKFISIRIKDGVTTGVIVSCVMVFSLVFYMIQTITYAALLPA